MYDNNDLDWSMEAINGPPKFVEELKNHPVENIIT